MFGLSFLEIVVVAVACVIFLKPEDLPVVMRKLGQFVKKIKDIVSEFTNVLEDKPQDIKPKSKILGLDGKYHDAYDITEVFGTTAARPQEVKPVNPEEAKKDDQPQ